jgi:hypothetical protein
MRRAIKIIILTTFVVAVIVGSFVVAGVAIALASGFFAEMAALGAFMVMLESVAAAVAWALNALDVCMWIELIWEWLKLLGLR